MFLAYAGMNLPALLKFAADVLTLGSDALPGPLFARRLGCRPTHCVGAGRQEHERTGRCVTPWAVVMEWVRRIR
ncbi:hypothetical protein GDI2200 [Gluconacetobacter diazotrophicus PA1 5]|uniref:Uncharacterized protein n=1 Tax=Gluconacetobacter diazotrophicus (strain ATCC 49037 / DSM 5601 / CCUG 37298 / CIP 103539 / LMG 7603 / PAl5) TaxID=272568 RepID=A9HLB0_GLUDA|nr:hypothetical protein GDI2200 [Gluconacetobacter diazotrophicus PA1 5]